MIHSGFPRFSSSARRVNMYLAVGGVILRDESQEETAEGRKEGRKERRRLCLAMEQDAGGQWRAGISDYRLDENKDGTFWYSRRCRKRNTEFPSMSALFKDICVPGFPKFLLFMNLPTFLKLNTLPPHLHSSVPHTISYNNLSPQQSRLSSQHFSFIFGKCPVRNSAGAPTILTQFS
jgi:hypothetical protein